MLPVSYLYEELLSAALKADFCVAAAFVPLILGFSVLSLLLGYSKSEDHMMWTQNCIQHYYLNIFISALLRRLITFLNLLMHV